MAGKKLLVADDSLTIQKVIRLALSNEGYEIQAVSDGNDAIQQISLFRPDAVLIDVSLPGKSAFEVKRAINEHADLEEVRFILMSSAFEKVDEPQADEVKFHGRLTKPFDPAHLRQVLTDVLSQVTAQRMEPTLPLQRPTQAPPAPSAPPLSFSTPPRSAKLPDFPKLPDMPHLPNLNDDESDEDSAEWVDPMAPEEEFVAAPASEPVGQLWDHEPTLTTTPPPVPAENDIKHLTESTIRMSGLDDFQWSVNEPSLKPSQSMMDTGGTSFQIEPPSGSDSAHGAQSDEMPPFQPDFGEGRGSDSESISLSMDDDEPSISHLAPPAPGSAASPSDFYRDGVESGRTPLPRSAPAPEVMAISPGQMEELIRKQVQQMLPELAERILKQEIHRMLSES
jgi:CheY-like chemotaxis protein